MEKFFDIVLVTVPPLIVFATAYLTIKSFLKKEFRLRQFDLKSKTFQDIVPIRLQAYERLTLFLERISPNNLIFRVRQPDMSAKEMQIALVASIRAEYEHNMSQQIYVSREAWDSICLVKDELIKIINLIGASLPPNASSLDYSKAILEHFMESESLLPNQRAMDILKAEVQRIYL
ncbi:MAG: hypothetical protein HKN92_10375 [Chitinophagales bacterium]|nr:hypothetical protein [Chitinophagales bacterium]